MMKSLLAVTLALIALASTAAAADKPDFSGEWKMNAAKSNYGPAMPPITFTRSIEHVEPNITIVEEQTGSMTPSSSRIATTDGEVTTQNMQGAEVDITAVWETDSLFVTTEIGAIGVTYKDRMTLSDDGQTLTSDVMVESAQGNLAISIVFERQ